MKVNILLNCEDRNKLKKALKDKTVWSMGVKWINRKIVMPLEHPAKVIFSVIF